MSIRLGYACINTSLKDVCCNRTCRLATAIKEGEDSGYEKGTYEYSEAIYKFLCQYGKNNLDAMYQIIIWSKENDIYFYRMSSNLFPHINNLRIKEHMDDKHWNSYINLDFAREIVFDIGKYMQKFGIRLSMHPDHYVQLGTKTEIVLTNTITDLKWHTRLLDLLERGAEAYCEYSKNKGIVMGNIGRHGTLCVHMGGTFGNKQETIKRWKTNFLKLPQNIRRRICLENCEKGYCVEDLLPICNELKIPLIFDFHHYACWANYHQDNPNQKSISELLPLILETWKVRNIIPKFHLSDQAEEKKVGAHHDYVQEIPQILIEYGKKQKIDIMIEAKMKEQATIKLKKKYCL